MKILLFVYLISSVSDREFILVQESWIYTYTSKPSSLDDIMSRRLATLVRDIGCNHYSCRENAIELLSRESSADSIRAFFWGSHHTNIDIAMRCRVALRRLLPCNHCNGSAICTRKNDTYSVGCSQCFNMLSYIRSIGGNRVYGVFDIYEDSYYNQICMICLGSGYMRLESFER